MKLLAATDQTHGYAFVLLAPEIARRLSLSTNELAALGVLRGVGFVVVAAAVERVARRRPRAVVRAGAFGRAGALAVGAIASPIAAGAGLAAYGVAGAAAARPQDEAHRLAGRLGNAFVPCVIALLAVGLTWPGVFAALAVGAAIVAIGSRPPREVRGDDAADAVVARVAATPWGRVAAGVFVAAGLTEFPVYVVVFAHLGGQLHVPIGGRAALIAVAELSGVAANLLLRSRLDGARSRPPQVVGIALAAVGLIGFGALWVAMVVASAAAAFAALVLGTLAISALVPVLLVGTRAVLAGVIPRRLTLGVSAALAGALLVIGTGDAATMAVLLVLPAVAALALATAALRAPERVAEVVAGVANVTPDPRIPVAAPALKQA